MIPSTLKALLIGALASVVSAKLVEYDWDIAWVNAAPDGFLRPVIGINNQWPCPTIRATEGDTIRVKMNNMLGNQTTSLHFHGVNQINTNYMDGPSLATQCPVAPGDSITYEFKANLAGTYWYHSHNMGQYPDGLRGPMIIDDPKDPYADEYDEEYVLTITEWFHEESLILGKAFLNPNNTDGTPPAPQSILLNEGQGADYPFKAGKNYRFRIINFAASASAMIQFDSHDMNVIMNDSAYVRKQAAKQLRITPAQRYDIIVKAGDYDSRNFGILVSLDRNRDYTQPGAVWGMNSTGNLIMDPEGERRSEVVDAWTPFDDATLKPMGCQEIMPDPDKTMEFSFESCTDKHGIVRHCINGSPYVNPRVPTLYTAATTGEYNTDVSVYGAVHPFIVSTGDFVDIVVNNLNGGIHPFHLHGYHFQVLARPPTGTGQWPGPELAAGSYNQKPPMRDTVSVFPDSYAVLRYHANNPGVYLFHCHIEWHVEMGLTATIIEEPDVLRSIEIPADHVRACKKGRIPYEGNAAGNAMNPLDTTGIDFDPPLEYLGAEWIPPPTSRVKRSRVERLV